MMHILLSLPGYVLVLVRISGLVLAAPVLGSSVIPRRLKAAFAIVVAAMLFPVVAGSIPAQITMARAVSGLVGELLVGVTIGLVLTIAAMGAQFAGLFIGQQAGMALAQVFDPNLNQQTTSLSQVYSIIFFLFFLLAGGLRAMVAALLDTFAVLPLLGFSPDRGVGTLLGAVLGSAMILAVRLSGPVLIALFLLSLTLGFLSRTMPQLNILSVGFSLRVMTVLLTAGVALTFCQAPILDAITSSLTDARSAMGLAGY